MLRTDSDIRHLKYDAIEALGYVLFENRKVGENESLALKTIKFQFIASILILW